MDNEFLMECVRRCAGVEKSACARVYSALTCAPLRQEGPLLAPEISLKVNMDSTLADDTIHSVVTLFTENLYSLPFK